MHANVCGKTTLFISSVAQRVSCKGYEKSPFRHISDPQRNADAVTETMLPVIEAKYPLHYHWVREARRSGIGDVTVSASSSGFEQHRVFYRGINDKLNSSGMKLSLVREVRTMGNMESLVDRMSIVGMEDNDDVIWVNGSIASTAELDKILDSHRKSGADMSVALGRVPWTADRVITADLDLTPYLVRFPGLEEKRARHEGESEVLYSGYLSRYQNDLDEANDRNPYQSLALRGFVEGKDRSVTNCANTEIYVLTGAFLDKIRKAGVTSISRRTDKQFYDFERHLFSYAVENGFNVNGVVLPRNIYWKKVETPVDYWYLIMDTLDGTFERSKWGINYDRDASTGWIAHRSPDAFVDASVDLEPPYFIGGRSTVSPGASLFMSVVPPGTWVGRDTALRGTVVVEGSGEKEQQIMLGEDPSQRASDMGGFFRKCLITGGSVPSSLKALSNVVFADSDGRTRIVTLPLNKQQSNSRLGRPD